MWQQVLKDPSKYVSLLAAVAGRVAGLPSPLVDGRPGPAASPWLRQIWEDLSKLAETTPETKREFQNTTWQELPQCKKILHAKLHALPKYETSSDHTSVEHHDSQYCYLCGVLCRGA